MNRFQVLLVAIALTSNSGATAWQQPAVVGSCRAITPINAVGRSERPLSDNSWAFRPPRACEKAPECTTHIVYKFRLTGICKSPISQEERKQLYHWHSFYLSKSGCAIRFFSLASAIANANAIALFSLYDRPQSRLVNYR